MRLVETLRNAPKRTSALVAIAAAVVVVPAALLAWGPDRPTYTIEHPADHVTFNSITNNPAHGDERNFVQIKEATASNSTYGESANLSAGKEYTVFVYYHNNAGTSLNASGKGIAKDVTARVEIPAIVRSGATATKSVGYISASNATPGTVYDDVSFKNTTGGDVALRYVPGSATIHNKGAINGAKVSDSIVTTGAKLGYNKFDGVVPGCNDYAGYVTFNVKADQANFTVEKEVRKTGTTNWSKSITANPGDSVDYLVSYKNTGTTVQNDVTVKDVPPTGVTYQNGTTKIKNALNPNGKTASDNIVSAKGLNISNYTPGSNAYVWFTAKIDSKDKLKCGVNTFVNKATVETNNGNKSDTATVTVNNGECKPEVKMVPVCDIASGKIVSVKESEASNPKYAPANSDKCKPAPKMVEVCDIKTGTVISVKESEKNNSNYAPANSDKCKNIEVCVIETKETKTIKKSELSESGKKYTTDFTKCETTPETPSTPETPQTPETPATPSQLPETGPADVLAQITGVVALAGSSAYYIASRRQA